MVHVSENHFYDLQASEEHLMRVIVSASQKGGSGKTTLSGHLAVEAEKTGCGPIALIDTDPQGSLAGWWNARESPTPYFAKVALDELGAALAHLQKTGVALAFIDTPPAVTASISQVVAHADLVLVPTRPSPHDLRAVGATVDIAERHNKPLLFVVNAATPRARITGEAAVALSQHGTVAPITIHHRVDFAASMVDGRTAGEVVPNSASAKEIRDLWTYIQDRLSRLTRDPNLPHDTRASEFAVSSLTPWRGEPNRQDLEPMSAVFAAGGDAAPVGGLDELDRYDRQRNQIVAERRAVEDRRSRDTLQAPFHGTDRRVRPFGRRTHDRVVKLGHDGSDR
jgi:chromosome partitioning protein